MRVNHGGSHVLVAEQLLNSADIIAIFKQIRCEGVTERVAGCMFVT